MSDNTLKLIYDITVNNITMIAVCAFFIFLNIILRNHFYKLLLKACSLKTDKLFAKDYLFERYNFVTPNINVVEKSGSKKIEFKQFLKDCKGSPFTVILGPSGAGKSALLCHLAYKFRKKYIPHKINSLADYNIAFYCVRPSQTIDNIINIIQNDKNKYSPETTLIIDGIDLAVPYGAQNGAAEIDRLLKDLDSSNVLNSFARTIVSFRTDTYTTGPFDLTKLSIGDNCTPYICKILPMEKESIAKLLNRYLKKNKMDSVQREEARILLLEKRSTLCDIFKLPFAVVWLKEIIGDGNLSDLEGKSDYEVISRLIENLMKRDYGRYKSTFQHSERAPDEQTFIQGETAYVRRCASERLLADLSYVKTESEFVKTRIKIPAFRADTGIDFNGKCALFTEPDENGLCCFTNELLYDAIIADILYMDKVVYTTRQYIITYYFSTDIWKIYLQKCYHELKDCFSYDREDFIEEYNKDKPEITFSRGSYSLNYTLYKLPQTFTVICSGSNKTDYWRFKLDDDSIHSLIVSHKISVRDQMIYSLDFLKAFDEDYLEEVDISDNPIDTDEIASIPHSIKRLVVENIPQDAVMKILSISKDNIKKLTVSAATADDVAPAQFQQYGVETITYCVPNADNFTDICLETIKYNSDTVKLGSVYPVNLQPTDENLYKIILWEIEYFKTTNIYSQFYPESKVCMQYFTTDGILSEKLIVGTGKAVTKPIAGRRAKILNEFGVFCDTFWNYFSANEEKFTLEESFKVLDEFSEITFISLLRDHGGADLSIILSLFRNKISIEELLNKAASQGVNSALYILGYFELAKDKRDSSKDEKKAFEYFLKMSPENNVNRCRNLALCYSQGLGVQKDLEKAFKYYKFAAENGRPVMYNNVYIVYKLLYKGKMDKEVAEFYRKKGLEFGRAMEIYQISMNKKNDDPLNFIYWLVRAGSEGDSIVWYDFIKLLNIGPKDAADTLVKLIYAKNRYFLIKENGKYVFIPNFKEVFSIIPGFDRLKNFYGYLE